MPVQFFDETDTDPGEWFEWIDGVEVKVRRILEAKGREIENHHLGRKRKVRHRRGATESEFDVEKQRRIEIDKAVYSMMETKGFELVAGGPGAAEKIGGILNVPLEVGGSVSLDGKWTDQLKAAVLTGQTELRAWVLKKSGALDEQEHEEEAEASKNSQAG